MADKKFWEDDNTDTKDTAPKAQVPGTIVDNNGKWWEGDTPAQEEKKKKKIFTPSIGGEIKEPLGYLKIGDAKFAYPNSVKSAISLMFGGPHTRGVPILKDLIPTNEIDRKLMENHPIAEKVGNYGGRIAAGVPLATIMPFSTTLMGTAGNAAVQGGLNAGVGTAERAVHDLEAPKIDSNTYWDAAFGASGPVAGKLISPFQKGPPPVPPTVPSSSRATERLDRLMPPGYAARGRYASDEATDVMAHQLRDMSHRMRSSQIDTNVNKWHNAIDRGIDAYRANPITRYGVPALMGVLTHGASGSVPMGMLGAAGSYITPGLLKGYVGNQAMGPTTQAILNAMLSSPREGENAP